MCIGICLPVNLDFQEWINIVLLVILALLIFIAVWKDIDQDKIKKLKKEINKKERSGINKQFNYIQKGLEYFGNLIVRQILDPYIVFPFYILLALFFINNNWEFNDVFVLTITLIAILWYSRETLILKQKQQKSNEIAQKLMIEQKKSVYLQLLEMEMKDKDSGYKVRIGYPLIVRKIIEKGEFDPKVLYSRNWH